jgi:phytoene dehydrogenase-like protein
MYKNLKTIEGVDILVVGAGSAGCVAALAAASSKYRVLVVERYGFLGGSSTQMLDTFYGFFTPSETPQKIVGGWPDEVVNTLNDHGEIFLRPNTYGGTPGLDFLLTTFVEEINTRGLGTYFQAIFIDNPARIFSFDQSKL